MNEPLDKHDAPPEHGDEQMLELERNTEDVIRRHRARERLAVKVKIIVQPGNAGDVRKLKVQGVTGDIAPGGFQALLPVPMRVGDLYRITFDQDLVNLPMTFARCVRCRLVREDAYESGFSLFTPIQLEGVLKDHGRSATAA